MTVSYPNYLDWGTQQTTLENLAAWLPAGFVFTGDGGAERIIGRFVTASFFSTLDVKPQIGRFFTDQEDRPGGDRVMVVSHRLWQRRFGGSPDVVGKSIQVNGGKLDRGWSHAGLTLILRGRQCQQRLFHSAGPDQRSGLHEGSLVAHGFRHREDEDRSNSPASQR